MFRSKVAVVFATALLFLAVASSAMARDAVSEAYQPLPTVVDPPAWCIAGHNVGNIELSVNNNGTLSTGWPAGGSACDCFTGLPLTLCEYPKGSNIKYLFAAALWVGAVVGEDTLVSTGADGWSSGGHEFRPDESPYGDMVYRSILYPEIPEVYLDAVSEQDYIAVYLDTFPYLESPVWLGIQHTPLDIEVTQSSYAWSHRYADDFVIVEYVIKNIGEQTLNDVCFGMYVDADVGFEARENYYRDDIAGYREAVVSDYGSCQYDDTINLAWIADNNGDPSSNAFNEYSATGVTGICPLGLPEVDIGLSFNWWLCSGVSALDFGPRERAGVGIWPEDYRDFGTGGLGTPEGDANKYYVLRNREIDYDQVFTASITPQDPIWYYPNPEIREDVTVGDDTRYLYSGGPSDALEPGQSLDFAFAYVAGGGFHTDPNNLPNLPSSPEVFYSNLNFSEIAENALFAGKLYDWPGYDTDGDGYWGEFRVCCETPDDCDTIWYKGDGVPDYRNAVTGASNAVWLYPQETSIRVRWNGLGAETTPFMHLQEVEFEGYKVLLSTDCSPGSFAEVGSYDVEDYRKYAVLWNSTGEGWVLADEVFGLEELRCLYGDSCGDEDFDPLVYTLPYFYILEPDSLLYFTKFLDNAYTYGVDTDVRKIYPDQPYPTSLDPEQAHPKELTRDGYLKYFEYETEIGGLLPNECYCVQVKSFDYSGTQCPMSSEVEPVCLLLTDVDGDLGQVLPSEYVLEQNYPNPFNPVTEIGFALPRESRVKLEIFNIVGQKVTTLVDGRLGAGHHRVIWDAGEAATGVYMYRLETEEFTETKKMLLIK